MSDRVQFTMLKLGWAVRFREDRHGRRDGKRGIPEVRDGEPLSHTPHEQALVERRNEVVDRVLQEFVTGSQNTVADIEVRYRRIASAKMRLAESAAALTVADVPLGEAEATRRGAGEEDLPEESIRARNQADRRKQIGPLRAAVDAVKAQLEEEFEALAKLEAVVVSALREAQARGAQYCAYTEGLRALYWRALVRVHPDRAKGVESLRSWPSTPVWLTLDDYRLVLRLGYPGGPQAEPLALVFAR
ncbi:hypothetical protein N8J89_31200 [Crossiella sp. CA-258035]|uniref:hypothetical protein n=1 Tax=Crossiella sp. CA-258035 TaxID=2981138 RepID=UPI0024BC2368|nr:hypothetical protein [Crossiella sp. CA-258035]WHT17563.1 hypothetical protein N8J89_31200 [Crossiella sp. CA-258035]